MQLLLVDDDENDRALLRHALGALGASIHEEDSLAGARRQLERQAFDCVVLDWQFPEGDATDFLRALRRDQPELPIIVVSGSDEAHLPERVLQAGAQDHLNKHDLGEPQLLRAVRFAIERQRSMAMQTRLVHADRLVSVGRLAAGIAHEVNNPATVLMTNLSVLESMLDLGRELDRAMVEELVAESVESIQRISSIMQQLTGFSRERSSGLVEVPLHELLDESVRLARPSMRHRADLTVHAGLVPPVVVDRTAIVGVLVNLLVNAQQAVDRAPPGDHRIRASLSAPGEQIVLKIEDSGVGVAESEREGIFDAFVTRREQGLGLGLAICREVINAHGGEIRVEDSILGGAAFVVELPLDTGLEATEFPEVPEWTMPLDVLVLEDETNVRNAIVRLLGPHRVQEATTVAQAKRALRDGHVPDVILCDLMLDGELGSAFFQHVQETAPELADRVLFVTGGAVTPEARQFLEVAQPPVIDKPFGAVELRFAIQQLLRMAVTRRSLGS